MMKLMLPVFVALILAGCATPYQPTGLSGGFTESRRGDVQIVRFQGNGYSSITQVEEMAYLRAAEIGKERGFQYMAILSDDSKNERLTVVMPSQSRTTGNIDGYGNFRATTRQVGGGVFSGAAPVARISVIYTNEKVPSNYNLVDVQSAIDDIGPKYKKKTP